MGEIALLEATIRELRRFYITPNEADRLGTRTACVTCANNRVADWLEELLKIKNDGRGEFETAMTRLFK